MKSFGFHECSANQAYKSYLSNEEFNSTAMKNYYARDSGFICSFLQAQLLLCISPVILCFWLTLTPCVQLLQFFSSRLLGEQRKVTVVAE